MTARTSTPRRISAAQLASSLRTTILRINRRMRQARPVGHLTPSQLSALTSLELGGALTPRELADVERVQPPTMTKMIAKLEEQGLIGRTPHPTDGRQVVLAATEAGRKVIAENSRMREAWLAKRIAELTPEERETLRRAVEILGRIARA